MNIELFQSVTTESALREIEAQSEQYQGLYVDMEDAKQRKYVKEKASTISGILKLVNRARIDLSKAYKQKVEEQAASIINRLEKANEPFTVLIDEHNAERKRVLDAEKEEKRRQELYIQIGLDHELALLIDKTYEADKAEAYRLEQQRLEEMREQVKAEALEQAKQVAEYEERQKQEAEKARLANVEHVRQINSGLLHDFMLAGVNENTAKNLIKSIAKNQIKNITINY